MVIFVAGGLTNQVVQRNDPRTEALFNPKTGLIVNLILLVLTHTPCHLFNAYDICLML